MVTTLPRSPLIELHLETGLDAKISVAVSSINLAEIVWHRVSAAPGGAGSKRTDETHVYHA